MSLEPKLYDNSVLQNHRFWMVLEDSSIQKRMFHWVLADFLWLALITGKSIVNMVREKLLPPTVFWHRILILPRASPRA